MVVIIEGVVQDVICVCVGVTGISIVVPPFQPHTEIAIDSDFGGGGGDDQSNACCRVKAGGGYE